MTVILDASALLAFLKGEPGKDDVAVALEAGDACVSAINWSEVAQKILAAGADWALARELLLSYQITIVPVTVEDAERAAQLWQRGSGWSVAERICMATAQRLKCTALTADKAWGSAAPVRQIR